MKAPPGHATLERSAYAELVEACNAEIIKTLATQFIEPRVMILPRHYTVMLIGFDSLQPVALQRWLDDGGPDEARQR